MFLWLLVSNLLNFQVDAVRASLFTGSSPTSEAVMVSCTLSPQSEESKGFYIRLWTYPYACTECSSVLYSHALTMSRQHTCFWNTEILTPIQKVCGFCRQDRFSLTYSIVWDEGSWKDGIQEA